MTHHGEALTELSGSASLKEAVASGDFGELPSRMRALCSYAVKLTIAPAHMAQTDIEALRAAGFDDRGIVDANQVTAYFNYVNRIADGLGVVLEERWPPHVRSRRGYSLRERFLEGFGSGEEQAR